MSMNEKSSHKAKHEGKPSCSFFCCKSSVFADSEQLEVAADEDGGVPKQTVSSRLRKKKGLPDAGTENTISASITAYVTQGNKDIIKKNRTKPPAPTELKETLAVSSHIGTKRQQLRPPQLSTLLEARAKIAPLSLSTEPVRNNLGRSSQPASPEPNPALTAAPRGNIPSSWAGKLDPKAGLVVLVVTLAVMAVSGGAASVVFLSAWLFLDRFFRQPQLGREDVAKEGGGVRFIVAGVVDMESEQHKKRVVLEGLLERKYARTPVHGN